MEVRLGEGIGKRSIIDMGSLIFNKTFDRDLCQVPMDKRKKRTLKIIEGNKFLEVEMLNLTQGICFVHQQIHATRMNNARFTQQVLCKHLLNE